MKQHPLKAIVTGGTLGIGLAIAKALAKEGHHVAICARNAEDLDRAKHALQKINPSVQVLTFAADLADQAQALRFANHIIEYWGALDVLVNNAGVFISSHIATEAEGTLEKLINTNLYSAYHLTRALLPLLLQSKRADIYNMCSVASRMAYPSGGSYSISKFALLGFSMALREELKPKGVRVVSVMPGATWSNSWAGIDLPEERLVQANDIAIAVMAAINMSRSAVVEEIVIRPQLGDL
jgi:short-subunit dehydrogenase